MSETFESQEVFERERDAVMTEREPYRMKEGVIKFLHLRYPHRMRVNGILYDIGVKARGGLTVGYQIVDGNLCVSFAKCSRKDNYSKKLGRHIVRSRMDLGKMVLTTVPSNHEYIIDAVLGVLPSVVGVEFQKNLKELV